MEASGVGVPAAEESGEEGPYVLDEALDALLDAEREVRSSFVAVFCPQPVVWFV